ncbi:MAG: hypothetical protein AAGF53_03825 [Pseudomonadota bacterium]
MRQIILALGVVCLSAPGIAEEEAAKEEEKRPKITREQIAQDAIESSSSDGVWVPMIFLSVVTSLVALN